MREVTVRGGGRLRRHAPNIPHGGIDQWRVTTTDVAFIAYPGVAAVGL
jgi:hypothetical protein